MKHPSTAAKAPPRRSTKDRIADYLRRRILTGALKPGERIVELDLAGKLGVSRSSVRETLVSLAREGIVEIIPYRGALVPALDPERFTSLQRFRIALEEFAVSALAAIGSPADFSKLTHAVERIRERLSARDTAGAIEADLQVHELIVTLARNPYLSRSYAELLNEFRLYIGLMYAHDADHRRIADDHLAVILAMRKGAEDQARKLVRKHIEDGFEQALCNVVGASTGSNGARKRAGAPRTPRRLGHS